MSVRCFEVLRGVLDRAYEGLPGLKAQKNLQIVERIEDLRGAYANLLAGRHVDYSDPVTRFAYLFMYVSAHSSYLAQIIEGSPTLEGILRQSQVNVACLGGGPGTEIIGMTKYLQVHPSPNRHVVMSIHDKEDLWSEEWSPVLGQLQWLDNLNVTGFKRLDVTDRDHWSKRTEHVRNSDLFLAVYFLSELFARQAEASEYFEHLAAHAKSGASFFYLDNSTPAFTDWFDSTLLDRGWSKVEWNDQQRLLPTWDEEKAELPIRYP